MEDKNSAGIFPDNPRALGVIPTYDNKLTIGSNGTLAKKYGDVLFENSFSGTSFTHTLDMAILSLTKIMGVHSNE